MSNATQSTTLRFFVISAAFIILVAGMRSAADMLVPFLLAIFIAVIATPPLHWLQNKGLPRKQAQHKLSEQVACLKLLGKKLRLQNRTHPLQAMEASSSSSN